LYHLPSNPLRDDLSDEVVYGRKLDRDILLSKRTQRTTRVRLATGLLADEVGDHFACRLEDRAHIFAFRMLATEVRAHLHAASSRFVGRVLRHSKGALVVAEENRGFALPESEIPQEHPEIECLSGVWGLRIRRRRIEGGLYSVTALRETWARRRPFDQIIKDFKRQANSLSRGSEKASTQGWRRVPLPSNTVPPRNGLYPYSPCLC